MLVLCAVQDIGQLRVSSRSVWVRSVTSCKNINVQSHGLSLQGVVSKLFMLPEELLLPVQAAWVETEDTVISEQQDKMMGELELSSEWRRWLERDWPSSSLDRGRRDWLSTRESGETVMETRVQDESVAPLTFYCSNLEVWAIEETIRFFTYVEPRDWWIEQ